LIIEWGEEGQQNLLLVLRITGNADQQFMLERSMSPASIGRISFLLL